MVEDATVDMLGLLRVFSTTTLMPTFSDEVWVSVTAIEADCNSFAAG